MPIDTENKLLLKSLKLENFRCFVECDIKFEKKFTVILADNGNGKTAVLDAIADALSMIVESINGDRKFVQPLISDVRQKVANSKLECEFPMKIDLHAQFGKEKFKLSRGINSSTKKYRQISANLKEQLNDIAGSNASLPLVTYYGIDRMRSQFQRSSYLNELSGEKESRLVTYNDSLRAKSSIIDLERWFGMQTRHSDSSHHRRLAKDVLRGTNTVLSTIEKILKPTDWSDLNWNPVTGELTVVHELQGRLPLSSLSGGIKMLIALVADIAIRCVSLNAELENPVAESHGIVLIDELCLHLHPKWQQHVMELMKKILPKIQFIVTTHSPLLVSTVKSSSIRVLHQNGQGYVPEIPDKQTQGVDASDALATVMDVFPVPDIRVTRQLTKYKNLIENGKANTKTANDLRSRLDNHFGDHHPVMVECNYLIQFQQFKLENEKPRMENTE